MYNDDFDSMTLVQLKEIAKGLGVKNISKHKKSELIEEIKKVSPVSIEKNGVVLREKITPKNNDDITIEKKEVNLKELMMKAKNKKR